MLEKPLPSLNWLKTFASAARLLNFTAAARELNMTQSAVSQQIRLLELHLGQALFIRQHKKLSLSNEGLSYLPAVQEAMELIEHTTYDIFSPLKSGVLTLQVNTAFLVLWLAPRLHEFTTQYPDVTLRLLNANWENEFAGLSTDLTITQGSGGHSDQHSHLLVTPQLRPFCSPETSIRLKRTEDLFNVPLIDVLGNHQSWKDWFAMAGLAQHVAIRHQVDTAATAVLMAEHHAGVCLSYDELVSDALGKGRLVAPFTLYVETVDAYYLVSNGQRPLSKAAQAFQEWLLDRCRSDPAFLRLALSPPCGCTP